MTYNSLISKLPDENWKETKIINKYMKIATKKKKPKIRVEALLMYSLL